MNFKKAIFTVCITIILSLTCFNISYGVNLSYMWSGSSSGLLETVSDTETDLKLESGGAILIEESSRFSLI